jgi:hypothetical protein
MERSDIHAGWGDQVSVNIPPTPASRFARRRTSPRGGGVPHPSAQSVRADCLGARCGKTWRQSADVPLNTLRSTGLSMPDT